MGVVQALHVVEERCPCLGVRPESRAIEQLALQGGEERFGDGIVVAIADRALVGQVGV